MPTPKPMATALTKFWMGYTSESAVMACSLIRATNKLSTILYSELTSIEMTLGSAMDSSSGNTGRVFIKVSFIFGSFLRDRSSKKRPAGRQCRMGAKTPHNGGFRRTIVWRKIALKRIL